jgi:excinuclease ABC subunit C
MARENAMQTFAERRDAAKQGERMVAELQRRLHLANAPKRIECLDIATFQGTETVGAIVAFDEGEPDKEGYRHYRIRSVEGTDDFAAVAEVLRRRFRDGRAREGLPDLLVIDGGLGQLGARRVLSSRRSASATSRSSRSRRSGWSATPPRARSAGARSAIFLPGRQEPGRARSRTRPRSSSCSACATRRTAS